MINYLEVLKENKKDEKRLVALGYMCNEGLHAIGEILYANEIEEKTINDLGSAILILTSVQLETLNKISEVGK